MTYTPTKFPRALAYGTATGIAGSVLSGTASNGGLTFFDGSGRISIPVTGYYSISAVVHQAAQNAGQTATASMTHLASNGTTDLGWAGMTSSFTSGFSQPDNGQGGSDHADVGLYAFGTFNAGELVRITETHAWGTPTIGLVVVFVPTPANPQ